MLLYTLATKVSRPVLHLRVKCRHQQKAVAGESMFLGLIKSCQRRWRTVCILWSWLVCGEFASFLRPDFQIWSSKRITKEP